MTRPILVLFLPLFILSLSCSRSIGDRTDLEELHRLRVEAIRTGDIQLFSRIISPRYRDERGGKEEKMRSIQETLARRTLVSIRFDAPHITSDGKGGEIVSRYRMRVRTAQGEMEINGEERLLVEREDGQWRIVGGL